MSRLSRQCGILNISQLCRPPWPVTGIALFYLLVESAVYCVKRRTLVLGLLVTASHTAPTSYTHHVPFQSHVCHTMLLVSSDCSNSPA
jgi:hypothetical protein